ncbi:MAG: cbb3-type cytochrome c oxidase subunit I [Desulfuromonadaceae bacterium]|nr:cbb3-type cytochrome c oxidase subunit I [Desulfuromonadaceae bacterium]MDD2846996.1 cbb3-type cytochrome c oxidase subunit I [Desulfuromonadaceae bacterium]MDD4129026.1 cbb3-type cytochrome c oxidase subunit I [Desulfuromonadaceae bacterium]
MNAPTRYVDDSVKGFITWSIIWGTISVLVGILISLQLAWPQLNVAPYLTYGRLRPIHTNAGIFGWGVGSFIAMFFYITQRLTRTPLWSPVLARVTLWIFNFAIASAAVTLAMGFNRTKEYAELEWPIALIVAVVWLMFSTNVFMTILKRKEEQMYISLWYIMATLVAVTILYVVNNLGVPLNLFKSYSAFSGTNDANVQWWYGHNAVAMVLTTPPLAIFYYFLPKVTGNPIYSHRMGIIAFWSLIFMYLWTGAHHLLWTPVPDWIQTVAMAFSIMLIAPSWGAVMNGYLTMNGRWEQMKTNYLVKFLICGITFYGLQTLQGPMQAVRSFSAFIHYTDWVPGHVHMGTMGWVSMVLFAAIYYVTTKMSDTEIYSIKLANTHFWLILVGQLVYSITMWIAGVQQGSMLLATNPDGTLHYSFMETMVAIFPYYKMRAVSGFIYLAGLVVFIYNIYKTFRKGEDLLTAKA